MRIAFTALALLLGCALTGALWANPIVPGMPRPRFSPPPHSEPEPVPPLQLRIVSAREQDRQTRLRLPANLLPAKGEPAPWWRWPVGPTNTLMAALALSLAVVLLGLWLARRLAARRLAGLACAGLALLVVVNLSGCPPQDFQPAVYDPGTRPATPLTRGANGALEGEALLEVSSSAEGAELMIDRDELGKLLKAGDAPR
jgi:hypothetical protein